MPLDASESLWYPSSPPPEDWDDSVEEWEHDGIVNEDVDASGKKFYEVKWSNWKRADGTNTTWEKVLIDTARIQQEWDEECTDRRAAKAKESLDVHVRVEDGQPWHEDRTLEIEDAYEEKLRERMRRGYQAYSNWDCVKRIGLLDHNDEAPRGSRSDSVRERREPRRSGRSDRSITAPVPEPLLGSGSHHATRRVNGHSRDAPDSEDTRMTLKMKNAGVRTKLEAAWARAASRAGAAPVYIVNDVNDEDVPPGMSGFRWCEQHYIRASDIPPPIPDVLVGCECYAGCSDARRCACQDVLEDDSVSGRKEYAYNKEGVFNLNVPVGVEVVECNELCVCLLETCPNRVAQRPRDVPLEIFCTGDHGWGVRATVDLGAGKVLGIYTGKLIRREDACELSDAQRSYVFDLDVHETGDEEEEGDRYSVDSTNHGNWSRFVNHSCDPNMRVYPVVWDTVRELEQPYLAFVTLRRIPARTELTIDYSPKDALELSQSRFRTPDGSRPCLCGTDSCRGWVRV